MWYVLESCMGFSTRIMSATLFNHRRRGTSGLASFFFVLPWVLLAFFVVGMVGLSWLFNDRDLREQQNVLLHNVDWVINSIRSNLKSSGNILRTLSRDIANYTVNREQFDAIAMHGILVNPDIEAVVWLNDRGNIHHMITRPGCITKHQFDKKNVVRQGLQSKVPPSKKVMYVPPYFSDDGLYHFEVHVPIFRRHVFMGTVAAIYSVSRFMQYTIPTWFARRYDVTFVNAVGQVLSSSNSALSMRQVLRDRPSITTPLPGLFLRIDSLSVYHPANEMMRFFLVPALLILIIAAFSSLFVYNRRLQSIEIDRNKLLQLSSAILCILDKQCYFLRVNAAFESIFGPTQHEKRTLFQCMFAEYHSRLEHAMNELVSGREACVTCEVLCIKKNNQRVWLAWEINADKKNQLFYAAAYDVTQRHAAEDALREEISFRRSIEHSMITGMLVVDLSGGIISFNQAFSQMIGWSYDDLMACRIPFPFLTKECAQNLQVVMERSRQQHDYEGSDFQIVRCNGVTVDTRFYVSMLIDSAGRQSGWILVIVDTTEQRRARRELEVTYTQFVTVLDSLEAAVSVYDEETKELLFVNAYYRGQFGSSSALHAVFVQKIMDSEQEGQDRTLLSRELCIASVNRWFEVRVRAIQWVDSRLVWMVVATDITERKRAHEFHHQQQESMQRTAHLVTMGEMASSLAHELNQPLTAIANYSEGCVKRIDKGSVTLATVGEVLKKIAAQASRAGCVIRSIRDFVKKNEPSFVLCDMFALLNEALELISLDVRRRRCTLRTFFEDTLPHLSVDRILIQQVLLNLIRNAMDAMEQSERREVQVHATASDSFFTIRIVDYGHGIDAQIVESVFTALFTTKPQGMGMGLNICRSIVEYHKGRLWVEANPEGGSIFFLTLPLAEDGLQRRE